MRECVCLPVRVCSRVCVGQRQTELPWLTCPVTSRQQERPRNKGHGYKAGFRTHVNQRPIIQSEPMIFNIKYTQGYARWPPANKSSKHRQKSRDPIGMV